MLLRFLTIFLLTITSLHAAPQVLVSVAPHKFLVERIAGDTVAVSVLVPPTANVHTFEPTPKQMIAAGKADFWFRIGESFEPRLQESLTAHNPKMQVIDLREGLDLIMVGCCKHHGGEDLHYWLSPKELKKQAQHIADVLSVRYPENQELYQKALREHLVELDQLNDELQTVLAPMKGATVLVVHPAYGYMARDFGVDQLSIETEGKDPTPQQLTGMLNKAKEQQIKVIFTQPQFNQKVAHLVAQQLGAQVKMLDPYAEDYMTNLRFIAHQFADSKG